MTFKVDQSPAVNQQIRALAQRAKAHRILESYLDAMRRIRNHLAHRPQEWGDPIYNTKYPGSVMYHGIVYPLSAHYVVYESLKIVFLTDIRPLPNSQLAPP